MEKLNIIETTEKIGNREYVVTKVPVLTDEEIEERKAHIESSKGDLIAERDSLNERLESIQAELKELDQAWADLF